MTIPTKPLTIGGVVIGGGSAVVGGSYAASKETVKSTLEDVLLPKGTKFNSDWDKKVEFLNNQEDNSLTEELKNIKEITNSPSETKRNKLQNWCDSNLNKTVSSIFQSKDEKLLKQIEKWCVLLIKDKLESVWKLDTENETDKEDWETKLKTLKSHTEIELSLTKELQDLKNKKVNEENDWKILRDTCKPFYERGFTGEDKEFWKLVNKFCTKPTIKELLNGTELPETADVEADWTKKVTTGSTSNTVAKDDDLKAKLENSSNTSKKQDLQNWCKKQYEKHKGSKVDKKNDDLLTEVKRLCSLTIEEKLKEDATKPAVTDTDKATSWPKNAKKLNEYSTKGNTNPTLTNELKSIQVTSDKDGSTNKDKVEKWCKDNWNKGYKGNNQDTWKMANEFCRKNTN